jgi:hypothetical protein
MKAIADNSQGMSAMASPKRQGALYRQRTMRLGQIEGAACLCPKKTVK